MALHVIETKNKYTPAGGSEGQVTQLVITSSLSTVPHALLHCRVDHAAVAALNKHDRGNCSTMVVEWAPDVFQSQRKHSLRDSEDGDENARRGDEMMFRMERGNARVINDSMLSNNETTSGSAEDLTFRMERGVAGGARVHNNSILSNSSESPADANQPLRTSYFTRIASNLLNSTHSTDDNNASNVNESHEESQVAGVSVDHTPPAITMADMATEATQAGPTSPPDWQRISSTVSFEHELESETPFSNAAYTRMRKTIDAEALMGGTNTAIPPPLLGSLRPVPGPFDLLPPPPQSGFPVPVTRGQRSGTVLSSQQVLQNDPRGTFRTTNAQIARQIFAAKHVRLQNRYLTDIWIYMKNNHPFLGIATAHCWHPYKKRDRVLVLVVALVLAFLACGLYATQECCKTVLESPVAVVDTRRLSSSPLRRLGTSQASFTCQPFGATCGDDQLCTQGAECIKNGTVSSRCIPTVEKAPQCSTNRPECPIGWRCNGAEGRCQPSATLLCYVPSARHTRAVAFATEDEETEEPSASSGSSESAPVDAISAIAELIKYGKANNYTVDGSMVNEPTTEPESEMPMPIPTPEPTIASSSSSSSSSSGSGSTKSDDATSENQRESLLVTLTKPTNGGVYGTSAIIPIEWQVSVIVGERSFVDDLTFQVDFSKDGAVFETIASDIAADTVGESPVMFHYDWNLAQNQSLTCVDCVLRICTQEKGSAAGNEPFCIRTDGAGATNTAVEAASKPKISFHIVKEVRECACGLKHASFVWTSYVLALVIPVAALLLEQLVTFYQDSKLFGMFARRDGPEVPAVASYASEATKRGRLVLFVLLGCLCVACGLVLAQINSSHFPGHKGEVVMLWLVTFLLVIVLGFIYCTLLHLAIFSVRWLRDGETSDDHQDGVHGDFSNVLASHSHEWPTARQQNALATQELGRAGML